MISQVLDKVTKLQDIHRDDSALQNRKICHIFTSTVDITRKLFIHLKHENLTLPVGVDSIFESTPKIGLTPPLVRSDFHETL